MANKNSKNIFLLRLNMKNYLRFTIGLVVLTFLLLGFRNQVFSASIETGDSNSSSTIINKVNETEIDCDCTPTPTETSSNPTPTPTEKPGNPTPTPTNTPSNPTPTPTNAPGNSTTPGESSGGVGGAGSGAGSSQGEVLGATTGQVLGLSTTSGENVLAQLTQLFGAFIAGVTGLTFFKKND
ncbi:hypothetical protein M1349_05745 [Patescibacteria group bacterium]|nr:hypothetical protein [Patescibacteria group bacterium]